MNEHEESGRNFQIPIHVDTGKSKNYETTPAQPGRESQLVNDIKTLTKNEVELSETINQLWTSLALLITPNSTVTDKEKVDKPSFSAIRIGLYDLGGVQHDNIQSLRTLIARIEQET